MHHFNYKILSRAPCLYGALGRDQLQHREFNQSLQTTRLKFDNILLDSIMTALEDEPTVPTYRPTYLHSCQKATSVARRDMTPHHIHFFCVRLCTVESRAVCQTCAVDDFTKTLDTVRLGRRDRFVSKQPEITSVFLLGFFLLKISRKD